MSTFAPGTSGSLKSTTLAGAVFETARLLDAAESARNAANPTLTPKQNITVTADFATRVVAIAATLPIATTLDSTGKAVVDATDYLGSSYSTFAPGTSGDLKSTDAPSAMLEIALKLAAAEKAVSPVDDQPNNIQVELSTETGTATITANLPITVAVDSAGAILLTAVDYL